MQCLFVTGSHLAITREVIPQGVTCALLSHFLNVDSFSLLYQTFLVVKDYAGLLEVLPVDSPHPLRIITYSYCPR